MYLTMRFKNTASWDSFPFRHHRDSSTISFQVHLATAAMVVGGPCQLMGIGKVQ